MTTYMSANAELRLGGETIGTVTELNVNQDYNSYMTGGIIGVPRTIHRQVGGRYATFTAYISKIDMYDEFINRCPMGIQNIEVELNGLYEDRVFKIEGYAENYEITDDGTIIITLESWKSPEEQEAEAVLNELRRRGYMQ